MLRSKSRLTVFLLIAMLTLVTMLAIIGCEAEEAVVDEENGVEPDENGMPDADETIVIGYTPPTYDLSDFYGQLGVGMEEYFEEYGEEHGINFEMISRSPAHHAAHQEQYAIVQDLIASDVDYVVIGPTSWEGQIGSYNLLMDAGIPFVVVNFSEAIEGVDALRWAAYSHKEGGMTVVDYIEENYPAGQDIAMIHGVPGELSDQRASVEEHLALGNNIVYEHWADFNREQAFDAVERMLEAHPDVDIIVAVSSAMAVGAVEACDAAGVLDQVDIFGAGGTIEELDALMEGRLTAVWLRSPIDNGAGAAEAITMHMEGKYDELEETKEWNTPITMLASPEDVVEHVHPVTYTSVDREFPTLD